MPRMNTVNNHTNTIRRYGVFILVVLVVLGGLLWLDLSNQGLAWRVFWSLTGEEEPLAQLQGMVEVVGAAFRQQPDTAPLTPIAHTDVVPYGINMFLEQEVELPKIEEQLRMVRDAGFRWIRQEFPWEDIEHDGRGQFTVTRDFDGDGTVETISGWEKYDRIVELTAAYGLELQVRLSNPPAWARAEEDPLGLGPPDDFDDYVNYAVAVAQRYRGRVRYYQIWNEPNIFPEWGSRPDDWIDAAEYTDLLCRTYHALKRVDPDIVVISGALAPTSAIDGKNINDYIFLQNMYDHGAGDCFDVLSMQGYGLNSGPTDHRMRLTDINFGRNLLIRDIMVRNGDAHKPIWISEAAWNPVGEPDVPRDVDRYEAYGVVTQEQAARYMPLAYQRAQEEWPWIGVINYWFFTRPHPFESNQSWFYFRMVEPDYSPERPTFTPLPVYETMRDYINNQTPTLYLGVHQAEHWAIKHHSSARLLDAYLAQLDKAYLTPISEFTFHGTDVWVRWRGAAQPVAVLIDGEPVMRLPQNGDWPADENGWMVYRVFASDLAETHTVRLASTAPFMFDSVTVLNQSTRRLIPVVAVATALGIFTLIVLTQALLRRRRAA
ncbi:MAG: hypothetical protein D6712_04745 [Chloroflexi bacterium]|nr:MAG: hypothetical protein D6712_04745 [Chloroflexota bacterium]